MSGTTSFSPDIQDSYLSETLQLTLDYQNDIVQLINKIDIYALDKEHIWNSQITQIALQVSQFVELTSLLSKVISKRKNHPMQEFKESHIHLLFVMKAMNQAQQKQDRVALEDLIKYELKDNLTQWKIDLIPQARRLLIA